MCDVEGLDPAEERRKLLAQPKLYVRMAVLKAQAGRG